MSERMKMPPVRDFGFYQRRKHDKWREVEAPSPALEAPVADSHAHVHMLPEPAWEIARCAANGVDFVCEICDPSEDELDMPAALRGWAAGAKGELEAAASGGLAAGTSGGLADGAKNEAETAGLGGLMVATAGRLAVAAGGLAVAAQSKLPAVPTLRMSAGVHPHNARLYDEAVEQRLMAWLAAPETAAVGEIGLDYHYDLSPREVQRDVFRRQVQIAKDLGLPVALHLRGGADAQADDAHREAFDILSQVGFPQRGTIVHCCALPPDELAPWIEAGCYIAYGGALTFKAADDAREGARTVPVERLLLETDSPYMAPEPMRGATCTPAHVIFTAARLAEIRGVAPGEDRRAFLQQLLDNTRALLG